MPDLIEIPEQFYEDVLQADEEENQYLSTGNPEALDKAIDAWTSVVERPNFAFTPQPFQVVMLSNAGSAFLRRYWLRGETNDLDRALSLWMQANASTSPNDAVRAIILNNLGLGFLERYHGGGELADLEKSILSCQQAVTLSPLGTPGRPMCLSNLASSLLERYVRTSNLADLEQSIQASEDAVALTPPDLGQDMAGRLNNLGVGLRNRYLRTGNLADLECAVQSWQQAVELSLPTFPQYAEYLSNLATGLRDLYSRTGNRSSLNRAIDLYSQAITATAPHAPIYSSRLNNLGLSLLDHYVCSGNLTYLDQAVALCRQSIALTPPNSLARALSLNNLGNALRTRYVHTRNLVDLEEAIQSWREAVAIASPVSSNLAMYLSSLGNGLSDRYDASGNLSDLEQAIDVYQRAVALTSPSSPNYASYLNNLGTGLGEHYTLTADPSDLEQAIWYWQQAIKLAPSHSPNRPFRLNNLGTGLRLRYAIKSDENDLRESITAYQQACAKGLGVASEETLRSSHIWGMWALERGAWHEAAQAFDFGTQAVDQLFRAQLLRVGKEAWLSEAQVLPTRLAYAYSRNGEEIRAVAALEQGRARLLNEALESERQDLESLPMIGYTELYQRYRASSDLIAQLERAVSRESEFPVNFDLVSELNNARIALDKVIEEIQRIPGYDDFFRALGFERVQRTLTANSQISVYLLATPQGGLALIVHADGVKEVWLDITETDLNGWLVTHAGGQVAGGYLPAQLGVSPLNTALNGLLPSLGEKVMGPVAATLKELSATSVMLVPTGRLALLPLHAARYIADGQTRTFIDDFTVAYTPSARALQHGQATLAGLTKSTPTLFAVGNPLPLPQGVSPLAFARSEVEEIVPLFDDHTYAIYEAQATRVAVEQGLSQATYLHFSCHGQFNADDPLESGIVLSNDERLTVKDLIVGQRLKNARLAVLSACQTAITDFNKLPEEVVGLPSGFLQAGVPGVVGTLWSVNDLSTALLMIKFYTYHLKDGLTPAQALRKAQLWLRDVTNAELTELFDIYRKVEHTSQTRMAYDTAQEHFSEHSRAEPGEKPFSHPYYWAPFVFYGV